MDIDVEGLKRICKMDEDEFVKMGASLSSEEILIHISNGASVLGVAHIDTEFDNKSVFASTNDNRKIFAPRLDNRLGIHIILNELPRYGVEVDVLLTSNSVIGMSTAAEYFGTEDYNWIFSFDIGGSGVAMYQYKIPELVSILKGRGLYTRREEGHGDIAELWFLGVVGLDFGNGIIQDGIGSFMLPYVAEEQIKKFVAFHRAFSDYLLPYVATGSDYSRTRQMYEMASDDGPEDDVPDEFDFSIMNTALRECDHCSQVFYTWELEFVSFIGEGAYLCSDCATRQDILSYMR